MTFDAFFFLLTAVNVLRLYLMVQQNIWITMGSYMLSLLIPKRSKKNRVGEGLGEQARLAL